jgi:hypothetical protein
MYRLLLAVLLAAACHRPTELVVIVDSDLAVPEQMNAVSVTITGPSGTPVVADHPLDQAGLAGLPLTLGVSPSGDALGPVDVEVRGMLAGSSVVTRSARTTLIRGESLALYMFLARDCMGVICDADETCTENGCAPALIDAATLPPWTGSIASPDAGADASVSSDGGGGGGDGGDGGGDAGMPPPTCETGANCDDSVDCTMDVCADDVCTHLPDDALCTAGPDGVCDPINGCQYSECTEATCAPGPCQTAVCDGTMCVRTSTCGAGEMCCANACVALGCNDGNVCTLDACDGASGCVHAPNDGASCTDGTFCNGAEVCAGTTCGAGTPPCTGSAVCDETNDVCTGCLVNEDCGAPVVGSYGACEGYSDSCDETGTRTRTRTTFTCSGAGMCVPSTTNESDACTRDTDGTGCGSTSCDGYGSCGGYSDTCDNSGTQSRTCNDLLCTAGTCQARARSESQGCSRNTNGTMCAASTCGACGPCGGFTTDCDNSGTCNVTCTDYACGSGTCNPTNRSMSMACSRNTNGSPCDDGLSCTWNEQCSGGSCTGGFSGCGGGCECTPSGCQDFTPPYEICNKV